MIGYVLNVVQQKVYLRKKNNHNELNHTHGVSVRSGIYLYLFEADGKRAVLERIYRAVGKILHNKKLQSLDYGSWHRCPILPILYFNEEGLQ